MSDETTRPGQDTSSDASGQSSGSKSGTTSKDKGKLYTDAMIEKVKSDAAAEAGRLRKAAEQERDASKRDLQSATSRLDILERERDESRLAEARGDPDQLRSYQRDQAITKREREVAETVRDIAKREEQLKLDRTEVDKDKGVVSVAYTAAKHGLKTEELESLGISDPEVLEKVAEKLAAAKPKEPGASADQQAYQALETDADREAFVEAHPGFEAEGEGFTPDSSEGTGKGGEPTQEQQEKMSMGQYAAYVEKRDAKK